MPTVFEYFGIYLKFFSHEHDPIHVHAMYPGGYGMKVELYVKDGRVVRKEYKALRGYHQFAPAQMRDLQALVNKYKDEIVQSWIDFVIKNKPIKKKVIRRKIK